MSYGTILGRAVKHFWPNQTLCGFVWTCISVDFSIDANDCKGLRFQPVDATHVLNLSAGVSIALCGVNW